MVGLTQAELARRSRTSRPTLSAYEHGRISPTVATFERILGAAGYEILVAPMITWREVAVGAGRVASVPDALPRLDPKFAFRTLELPLHVDWSLPGSKVNLANRRERARAYEAVLREGRPRDIAGLVDGALMADQWDELVLPQAIREAWQPLIENARGSND